MSHKESTISTTGSAKHDKSVMNIRRIIRNTAFATIFTAGLLPTATAQANSPQVTEQQPGCRFVGLGGSSMSCICGENREIHWPQDCETPDGQQVKQTQSTGTGSTGGTSEGFSWEAGAFFAGILALGTFMLSKKGK